MSCLVNHSIKHLSLINKICDPIFNFFGFSYFYYAKTTLDGVYSDLVSNVDYKQYYFSNKLYCLTPEYIQPHSISSGFYFYQNMNNEEYKNSLSIAGQKLNLIPYLGFVHRTKNSDIIRFGYGISPKQFNNIELFVNSLQLITEFNRFFYNEAKDIINEADNYAINLKDELGLNFISKKNDTNIERIRKFHFLSRISSLNGLEVEKLTAREIDCLNYLHRGMTSSEIGKKLFISSRTVEFHLANIKDKYNLAKKCELFKLAEMLHMAGYFEELILANI